MLSADELSDADHEEPFYGEDVQEVVSHDVIENAIDELDVSEKTLTGTTKRPGEYISTYIRIFEDMVNLVSDKEYHLLSEEEWDVFTAYSTLPYNVRFLIVRLALRKAGQWYPLAKLDSLKKEVGDGLSSAIDQACRPIYSTLAPPVHVDNHFEPNVIDLTIESDGEQDIRQSCTLFCHDETNMTLDDMLNCLSVDQLRSVAKDMKVPLSKQTKAGLISSLCHHAANQSTLTFPSTPKPSRKGKGRDEGRTSQKTLDSFFGTQPVSLSQGLRQSKLEFVKQSTSRVPRGGNQESALRKLALRRLVKCVRLRREIYDLFLRVHIIAFRSTEMPTSLALPALLTAFKKRSYSNYTYERDGSIWSTRKEFSSYVEALLLNAKQDSLLAGLSFKGSLIRKTNATPNKRMVDRPTKLASSPRTPLTGKSSVQQRETLPVWSENDDDPEESPREKHAKEAQDIFETEILPAWKVLLTIKQTVTQLGQRKAGLERFEPGFVYTRMVHHSLKCLATLKQYTRELAVVESLLAQKSWLRGKRARWYERRAILLTRYLSTGKDGRKDRATLARARDGVIEALHDEDTSLVFRPSLFRRLIALEKRLEIPAAERTQCEGQLRKPAITFVEARRRWERPECTAPNENGRIDAAHEASSDDKENDCSAIPVRAEMTLGALNKRINVSPSVLSPTINYYGRWKGKSLWQGTGGPDDVVNVEIRALQAYQENGYKGFHSETSVLTTLFGLLFWDIIFFDVPGAFETPYQTSPLDLGDEIFYYARKDLIDTRLKEIRNGWAEAIIEKHDSAYRAKATWCIGVRWDVCEREDLLQIVRCLGKEAIAVICQLFCESYNERRSGVPDLVVWNMNEMRCKFVEVKGPGDTERENQKLWMDSLLNAGTEVEVCRVHEPGKKPGTKKTKTPLRATERKITQRKSQLSVDASAVQATPGHVAGDEMQVIDVDEWIDCPSNRATPCPSSNQKRRLGAESAKSDLTTIPSISPIPMSTSKRTRLA